MTWIEALFLGVMQGISEFLPISSSGHLIIGEELLGLNVADLKSFDVVVHMGTLMAILVYFRNDLWEMIRQFFGLFKGKFDLQNPYMKLVIYLLIGTVPAVFAGLFLEDIIDGYFRHMDKVAICMIFIGFMFVFGEIVYKKLYKKTSVENKGGKNGEIQNMTTWKALLIGTAQAFALIPGISRSGSTIVSGLFFGIRRDAAARFSFLLGVPAIFGAGLLTSLDFVVDNAELGVTASPLFVGFFSSFAFGLLSVWGLMKFLKNNGLWVFAFYLILLGISVLTFGA